MSHVPHRAAACDPAPGPAAAWAGGDERACPKHHGSPVMLDRPLAACARARPHAGKWSTIDRTSASRQRPPRMPALHRSDRCPHAERPPDTGRRPWAREYDSLSLKKTVPVAGTVPGSDESNKRLSVVRARRRTTTRDQRGAHDG